MLMPFRRASAWRLHSKIFFSIHLACEKLTDLYLLTDFDFSFRWRGALLDRNAKPVMYILGPLMHNNMPGLMYLGESERI